MAASSRLALSRLKQQVNSETRADHRALMDNMIRLYAEFKEVSKSSPWVA